MKKENQEHLDKIRHSASHLLAAAVLELFPETKPTLGPSIENGFYYDFDFGNQQISEEDLPRIEEKMRVLLSSWASFSSREVSAAEAKEIFKNNEYKIELINEHAGDGEKISLYKSGNFEDLCKGGHAENPSKEIGAFKLLSLAGAYWRGDEKNKMLTRIYGTAFPSKEELDEYLEMQEEAKKRDHRKLGKELNLFVFSDLVGKGLPLWTPRGATIRRELERFIVDEEIRRGYLHVYTPDIANLDLYRTSGHYPYYKDSMYAPITIDDEEYMLRPMTCPHHFELYKSQPRSYKELPMRIAELAKLYRYEQSGELTGLIRVRGFCLADAHIVAKQEQAKDEIVGALDLIEYVAKIFGLVPNKDYWYRLSLGDRKDEKKYYKDDAAWDFAEDVLREVLKGRDVKNYEAEGEAAFYGPKIDIQMRNVNGKEDTAFTVQYDFVMPKRFNLKYIDENGNEVEPMVVHRSSVGAIERIIGFLIERYAGAFPTWMAPEQVKIIPVSEKFRLYAHNVERSLKGLGKQFGLDIRVEVDDRAERLQSRIRDAELMKVPYILVVGGREEESSAVAVRVRHEGDKGSIGVEEFGNKLIEEIRERKLESWK
jgi:threonyl-tRNA synthetase